MINIKYLSPESRLDTIKVTQLQTRHIRQRVSERAYVRVSVKCKSDRGRKVLRHSLKGFGANV